MTIAKEKTVTVFICEECGKEFDYEHYKCLGCGRSVCFDCRETLKEYHSVLFHAGSGDGYFCPKCDSTPPDRVRVLHEAYRVIESLRSESKSWNEEFRRRTNKAEAKLRAAQREDLDDTTPQ